MKPKIFSKRQEFATLRNTSQEKVEKHTETPHKTSTDRKKKEDINKQQQIQKLITSLPASLPTRRGLSQSPQKL